MHCRVSTPKMVEFRSKLGFYQYDITLTKEQSVLKSVMAAFEGENMQTQYSVLGYKIDLYFHDYRLGVEVDKFDYCDENNENEIRKRIRKSIRKRT